MFHRSLRDDILRLYVHVLLVQLDRLHKRHPGVGSAGFHMQEENKGEREEDLDCAHRYCPLTPLRTPAHSLVDGI